MNKFILYILLLLFFFSGSCYARETALIKIRSAKNSNNVQLFLTFEEAPSFRHVQKGKRIDIVLESLLSNTEPIPFTPDDKVVKFLTQQKADETILTFFLRYDPQKYKISRQDDTTLVLDILLGNQFTKAYPELSTKLEGLTVISQQGADFANPYVSNPYRDNWRSFFANYKPAISTSAPIKLSTPPFPIIDLLPDINSSELISDELFSLAADELWVEMIPMILNDISVTAEQESKKLLALTFGEILFHSGDFENSYKQLYLLREKYPEEYVGVAAAYLLARLVAEYEDIHIADYEFRELDRYIENSFRLSPFIHLSQIETALATNQLARADELLQRDDIAFPPKLAMLKELRQSDYWFATNNDVKAYVGYQLFKDKIILDNQPYSLNGYCSTLFRQKKFQESSNCYQRLSATVSSKEELSNISLKKALAELEYKTAREMYVIFSSIEDAYPGTMAGFRAAMKKADIRYLSQPSWRKTSAKYYKAFAEKATDRHVAEEAALKEAIVHHELGDDSTSINLLLQFLRDYRAGKLTVTARALLIEILPKHLQYLLTNNQYIDALVLAKKNRELFQKNWIDPQLLSLLAEAYHQLSIFEEAKKLYLYLLSTVSEGDKEQFYLPLITILYSQDNFDLVEDFATQYFYNYPDGKDSNAILLLRLRSLVAADQDDKALGILSKELPQMIEIAELAAALHFRKSQYSETIDWLEPYLQENRIQSDDSLFILAESYFQNDRKDDAEKLFHRLKDKSKFFDHAQYRLAVMEKDRGEIENSLKLFQNIVEKGNDPLWQKLAQRELEFHQLANKY